MTSHINALALPVWLHTAPSLQMAQHRTFLHLLCVLWHFCANGTIRDRLYSVAIRLGLSQTSFPIAISTWRRAVWLCPHVTYSEIGQWSRNNRAPEPSEHTRKRQKVIEVNVARVFASERSAYTFSRFRQGGCRWFTESLVPRHVIPSHLKLGSHLQIQRNKMY